MKCFVRFVFDIVVASITFFGIIWVESAMAKVVRYGCGTHQVQVSDKRCEAASDLTVTVDCSSSPITINISRKESGGDHADFHCDGNGCVVHYCCGGDVSCCDSKDNSEYCCKTKYGLIWDNGKCHVPCDNLSLLTNDGMTCCQNGDVPAVKVNTCCMEIKKQSCSNQGWYWDSWDCSCYATAEESYYARKEKGWI